MRSIMIVGLAVVLLIVGILAMQNMGVRSNEGQTETQARDYIDRAEETAETVEARVQDLEERLNRTE
ncbi:MAG: hypothetical protein QNJ04_15365 [Desulfobacterales bacterium]|nr:hypothetical protein [Desulfobacterales bacterium]